MHVSLMLLGYESFDFDLENDVKFSKIFFLCMHGEKNLVLKEGVRACIQITFPFGVENQK